MDWVDVKKVPEWRSVLLVVEDNKPHWLLLSHGYGDELDCLRVSVGALQESAILVEGFFEGITSHLSEAYQNISL